MGSFLHDIRHWPALSHCCCVQGPSNERDQAARALETRPLVIQSVYTCLCGMCCVPRCQPPVLGGVGRAWLCIECAKRDLFFLQACERRFSTLVRWAFCSLGRQVIHTLDWDRQQRCRPPLTSFPDCSVIVHCVVLLWTGLLGATMRYTAASERQAARYHGYHLDQSCITRKKLHVLRRYLFVVFSAPRARVIRLVPVVG